MKKWEYMILETGSYLRKDVIVRTVKAVNGLPTPNKLEEDKPELLTYLNKVGDSGWEVASDSYALILKRPKK